MRFVLAGLLIAAQLLAGCVSTATIPSGALPALSGRELDAAAALLRLEDRREWDAALLDSLAESPSAEIRRRAALALGRLGEPRGRAALERLLADPDTAVAATAAFSLGQLGDTLAVPALATQVTPAHARRSPTVVGEAAAALGKLGTERAAVSVTALLQEIPPGDAPAAAVGPALLALWHFPTAISVEVAGRWTGSGDPALRWRAAYSLARRAEPAAIPLLLRLTRDPDVEVRMAALRGVRAPRVDSAGAPRAEALRILSATAVDPDPRVRVNAARSLGTFRAATPVRLLRRMLGDRDPGVAIAAAEALGRIGSAAGGASAEMARLAGDAGSPEPLRIAALLALAEVDPSSAPAIARGFAEAESWRMRAAAARTYAAKGQAGRAGLERGLADADVRVAAAALGAAVERFGDSVALIRPWLVRGLTSPDVGVRAVALGGLAELRDPATLPMVLDAYDSARADSANGAALAAVAALAGLREAGVAGSGPFFGRFARSPDPVVRSAVAAAFGDTATAAWSPPHPIDTGRGVDEYREIIRRAARSPAPRVVLHTSRGEIEIETDPRAAPLTTENFLRLAASGYFDGQEWPRVVPNFVIQGGDPRGDTSGGPGYSIRDELNRLPYLRGTVGMALSGPDTGGSQFFVTHSPQPHLDGGYTVFGRVVRGMETVGRIQVGDRIVRTEIVR